MAKIERKTRPNRSTTDTERIYSAETQAESNTPTIAEPSTETIAQATSDSRSKGEENQDEIILTPVRKKRKTKSAKKPELQATLGQETADIVIALIQTVGSAISDESALTQVETFLISTGISNMPQSERMNEVMQKFWPVLGVLGIGAYGVRIFTNRRRPVTSPPEEIKMNEQQSQMSAWTNRVETSDAS